MAGIYDRISNSAEDNIPVNYLVSLFKVYAEGLITLTQLKGALNAKLDGALTASEDTDISNIATVISRLATSLEKAGYVSILLGLVHCKEADSTLISESAFRTKLGI